ncbi:MAG: gliding motility-associated C-terminal domain-containing protein [Mucilaginibacter sp.]
MLNVIHPFPRYLKRCHKALLGVLVLFSCSSLHAQAPNIHYQTPQVYFTNTTISPLAPKNTGGAVPATIYAQVTAFVGSGTTGYADGTGTSAIFGHPARLAQDPLTGNLYVADRDNGVIRKVTPAGVVTTFATGFNQPNDVILDGSGNMYVADAASNSIKFVTSTGIVSTFAGGNQGFANGVGMSAAFYYPYGLGRDAAGNIYVADSQNNAIRKISPSGVVTTFAGTGSAGSTDGPGLQATFNDPNSIAMDASGNLYIGDSKNNKVRKITSAGVVSIYAGTGVQGNQNGPLTTATFTKPGGVAFDAAGNTYIADVYNYLIRKVDKQGNVTTLAGSGTLGTSNGIGTAASFSQAYGLNYNNGGFLYVTDLGANNIRKICLTGYTIDKALPPGLSFDPTTGIITGTPTTTWPSTDYTVTAYNLAGSSSTIVNISVNMVSAVNLAPLADKTICSADFAPTVTGGTGTYTITSSNTNVASLAGGKIHIVAPGTTTITATDGFTSQSQSLTVDKPVTPTITINPSFYSGCDGLSYTYTATVTGAGTNPTYQWYVNGQPAGTNSNSFTSSSIKTGDIINCTLTNTTDCVTGPATSNNASLTSIPYVTPAVTIQSSATGTVAPGSIITFTATATNGGSNPVYQWKVNNVDVGTNSSTYSNACFNDGDVVTCTLTNQGGACLTTTTATSNIITVSTTGNMGAITVNASATTIYAGQLVTFTVTGVSFTNSPVYQWKVNDKDVGTNSSTYTTYSLKNDDTVTCALAGNGCSTPITGNAVIMTVLVPPGITIPTAFTPNNDGINDQWQIEALAGYPNCMVNIFTRYGAMIYHSKGYSQPWDGTFNGAKLAPGTYYYLIDLGNSSPKLSGYVTLIR